MERRVVLAGLAALAASPALAQTSPAPPTDAPAADAPAPSAPATEPAPAPAMKMAPPLAAAVGSEAVTQHRRRTMAAGALSLATSRVALAKAKNPLVKQFAEFETAEQETIGDILKGLMTSGSKPSGDIKAPTEPEIDANLDAKGKDLLQKMRTMKAGPEFDRDYVKAQIEGHHQLLDFQADYLKVADDLDETNVAKLARGMIKEHLTLLGDLEKRLG